MMLTELRLHCGCPNCFPSCLASRGILAHVLLYVTQWTYQNEGLAITYDCTQLRPVLSLYSGSMWVGKGLERRWVDDHDCSKA